MLRLCLIACLTALLSACSVTKDRTSITGSTRPISKSLASEIDPNYAVAYFPSVAGPISSVRQKSGKNRVHQTILYPNHGYGGGENQIIVDVAQSKGDKAYFQAPTRNQLLREMKRFFPSMVMTIDEVPGKNLHGIYGYAYGTSKIDGNCIFAWQVITQVTRQGMSIIEKAFQPHYRAKVRVRYCHPSKSKRELLVLMNGFRVKEVVGSTIEMLRFAEGAGYVKPQTTGLVLPVVAKAPTIVAPKVKKRPTRTITKKVAVTRVQSATGPRVLLPTELGASGEMRSTTQSAVPEVAATDLIIPLPN